MACRHSLAGLRSAFLDEIAFRQILALLTASALLACWLADTWTEMILLLLPPFISVIAELLNTAVENAVDLASPEWSLPAKKAKDTASAAQFVSQLVCAGVWLSFIAHKFFF